MHTSIFKLRRPFSDFLSHQQNNNYCTQHAHTLLTTIWLFTFCVLDFPLCFSFRSAHLAKNIVGRLVNQRCLILTIGRFLHLNECPFNLSASCCTLLFVWRLFRFNRHTTNR